MASIKKSVVATGASSGLGFEAMKQLLTQGDQPYNIFIGVRDADTTRESYEELEFDKDKHALSIFDLELSYLKGVKHFAEQVLEKLGNSPLDYLLLNAAISDGSEDPGPYGSKWSKSCLVNHLAHHYLVHLLRDKLVASHGRVVFVSSGAYRGIEDPNALESMLLGGAGVPGMKLYSAAKFVALLGAHWWNRQLAGQCKVVAVNPGVVPNTNIGKGAGLVLTWEMPSAKSIPDGAGIILGAFWVNDFPDDPEQIFRAQKGWLDKETYQVTLDRDLQEKWCLGREELEKQEGI
ncbi:NAD(P)-binding protein [Thozetella sp. PMI_491]|nr:NAD(P)-binding protein [Thozetella sp. PMI_491]